MARLRFPDDAQFDVWLAEQCERSGVPLLITDSAALAKGEQILTDALPRMSAGMVRAAQ